MDQFRTGYTCCITATTAFVYAPSTCSLGPRRTTSKIACEKVEPSLPTYRENETAGQNLPAFKL